MKNLLKSLGLGSASLLLSLAALILVLVGGNQSAPNLAGITNFDSLTLGDDLVVSGLTSLTGTTTIAQSVDGLVVGGTISTAATGTVITLYTNSTGPKMCDASTGYLRVQNNGSFAPSLVWSLGTSTSAALASTNLVASSTVATTTTTDIAPTASLFRLAQGETLTVIFGDITNTEASSTYLGNWSAEAGIWCQDLSI